MSRYSYLYIAVFLLCGLKIHAQEDFYLQNHMAEIRLSFPSTDWQHKLDSIFIASNGQGRMIANVVIDGKQYKNVGVRYKGFSSWNEGEIKNPYNIELDYTIRNQNHQGYTKIKLSNVIHDPSFIREALAYEIVRKYMPASHASFARLFVNDAFIGLYSNIESVDKIFAGHYYQDNKNTFVKGDPDVLEFPFGQNANLAHTHGDDSLDYMPFYKLESDYGWKDLYHFIYVLNEQPDSVEKVLNTDRTLWMHALNYTLLNLDSYIGYAQNYYIYKDDNGRFNPIIWDLNMSFGSFRLSDASTHFQGLTIEQLKSLDPLQHLNFSISPRPLMKNLFLNETYKKMYLAHMRTILDENIRNNWYYDRGNELMDLIRPVVQQDTNKFYSDQDFENNISVTVGGTGGMLEYPGLKDLMQDRLAYLDTYPGFTGAPVISHIVINPAVPEVMQECQLRVWIDYANQAFLAYRYHPGDIFTKTTLYDDGAHGDGGDDDGVYGASIPVLGNCIQYYIYAENESAGTFSPQKAEYEYYTINVQPEEGDVCINEVYTNGSPSPWMELLNTTDVSISLKGVKLASFLNKWTYSFPDTLVPPRSFVILYFNSDTTKPLHCPFDLSGKAGILFMYNYYDRMIDELSYTIQVDGKSYGRYPNLYGPFVYMTPTISANNLSVPLLSSSFLCYPNPAGFTLYVEFVPEGGKSTIEVFNVLGQKLIEDKFYGGNGKSSVIRKLDVAKLASGTYIVSINNQGMLKTQKFFKY